MKALRKRYRKTKWIDTHFSEKYKQELAAARGIYAIQLAAVVAAAALQASRISCEPYAPIPVKAMALLDHTRATAKALEKISHDVNERKQKVKLKWGFERGELDT
jgi:ABC-type iron transport system FetAB permease component